MCLALLSAAPSWASDFSGNARVIDGDTIDVGEIRVRLFGIDAPELDQSCDHPTEGRWACGASVKTALARWIDGKSVTCTRTGTDRYGRTIAICHRAGQDIGAVLVDQGLAFAFKRYSNRYVAQEKAALVAGRGLWTSAVVAPGEHRAEKRAPVAAPSGQCDIKGNISADGKRIYHLPGQHFYSRTRISESKGERWFCTEAQARTAGWRRARR